jgi:hypothetical protein
MGQKEVFLIFNVLDHFYQYRMYPQLVCEIFCLDYYIGHGIIVAVILYFVHVIHVW